MFLLVLARIAYLSGIDEDRRGLRVGLQKLQ